MVASAFTAPHVTEFLTVDVTPMMELRDRLRARPEFAGVKLTPLAFVAPRGLRGRPADAGDQLGVQVGADGHEIVVKDYVNLGIAAATAAGLIVPVIRDADAMTVPELAAALAALTADRPRRAHRPGRADRRHVHHHQRRRLRRRHRHPDHQPGESAILALGSIKDAPWVVDGQLAVRKVCQLALSFDHRVIDGQQGSPVPGRRRRPARRPGARAGLLNPAGVRAG